MVKRAKRTTRISRENADLFSQKLSQLPPKKKATLTPKELVFENAEQLCQLLDNGYNYDDLADILREENIHLSAATVRQYMSEARKAVGPKTVTINSQQSPERKKRRSQQKDTQPSPEQSSPNQVPHQSTSHPSFPSEFDFDDDPELVEMSEIL